jgi:uncharacterized phage protein (predicted DNA packaging)
MLDLDLVKNYLRIDGSEDDRFLTLLMNAAKEDLKDAGVPDPEEENERYNLAIMLFVSLHYENRDPSMKIDKLNAAYQNLILKLKN